MTALSFSASMDVDQAAMAFQENPDFFASVLESMAEAMTPPQVDYLVAEIGLCGDVTLAFWLNVLEAAGDA